MTSSLKTSFLSFLFLTLIMTRICRQVQVKIIPNKKNNTSLSMTRKNNYLNISIFFHLDMHSSNLSWKLFSFNFLISTHPKIISDSFNSVIVSFRFVWHNFGLMVTSLEPVKYFIKCSISSFEHELGKQTPQCTVFDSVVVDCQKKSTFFFHISYFKLGHRLNNLSFICYGPHREQANVEC